MSENHSSIYGDLQQDILSQHSKLKETIENLSEHLDSEYAFQSLAISLLFTDHEDSRENLNASLIELAAYYLYPRFGQDGSRDPDEIQRFITALKELNRSRSANAIFSDSSSDKDLSSLQGWLQSQEEIVRGNAYPFQSRLLIENIQGPFESWFKSKIGIGPFRIFTILDTFEEAINENLTKARSHFQKIQQQAPSADSVKNGSKSSSAIEDFMNELPLKLIPSFGQIKTLVSGLSTHEWNALKELIGLTPASREKIQYPREIKSRPLYFLSNDKFIFFALSSVYDALFQVLETVARSDQSFHQKSYDPKRSQYIEEEIYQYCLRLFPSSAVYKNLTYPDPDKLKGEAELDVAVFWGPFLLIIEAKGSQFSEKARLGNPSKLKNDLINNIQDGHRQATRAIRFIEANAVAIFKEKNTNRTLTIKKDSLHRIFPINVTLHHFSGLATQLALLKKIGLFKNSSYPWSVALTDFDIITKFAGYPDAFLHYIQRRLDLQYSEKQILGDELDLFAYYLDTRLHPSQYWERQENGRECSSIFFSDNTERFDQFFQADYEGTVEKPNIGLSLPPKFTELINELRQRDDYSARWIAFALLELSQEAVNRLEEKLESLKTTNCPCKGFLRDTFKEGDLTISLMTSSNVPKEEIEKHTYVRANIEKYRLNAVRSIAIGIDLNDTTRAFECAFWIEYPWLYDQLFEDLLLKDRPSIIELS